MPKGFISVGKNNWLNVNAINMEETYIDTKLNKVIVVDKFGIKHTIDRKEFERKVELK